MYAFGLEESGQYREAEREAHMALEMNRYDCWATHASAHVLEMTGRYEEGLQFMEKTLDDWVVGCFPIPRRISAGSLFGHSQFLAQSSLSHRKGRA